jgi:phytoene dehydrogenase-like protein
MRLFERGLEVSGPRPFTRILSDNRPFIWWSDQDQLRREIAQFSVSDSQRWGAWKAFWGQAAELFGPFLLSYPPSPEALFERARRLGYESLLQTLLTTSVAVLADRFFESPEMRGSMSSPHDMGSLWDHGSGLAMALASAVECYTETGATVPQGYVKGGMGRVTEVMSEAAASHGATVRLGAPVDRIDVENDRVTGVVLESGEHLRSTVVLSNADTKRTFGMLVDTDVLPPAFLERIRQLRTDIAPLKFHCALSELPEYFAFPGSDLPTQGLITINPTREYHERAWDDARHGRLPEAPFMVVMTPTTWDASLAPPGSHTVSFWILFAPVHLAKGTWPNRRDEMAERLIAQMDLYSPNFRRALRDHVLLTPWDLEQRVLLTDGNIHHVDITPTQMLWQRPLPELAHYRAPIDGLYLCGAGQHPYGEVSGGPGHNAAHAVLEDLGLIERGSWEQVRRADEGAVDISKAVSLG